MRWLVAIGVMVPFVGAIALIWFVLAGQGGSLTRNAGLFVLLVAFVVAVLAFWLAHRHVRAMRALAVLGFRTTPTAQGLFTAGTGMMPPHFAGRVRERDLLSRFLSDLVLGKAPPSDVILVGPRGSGKTVLLRWFADACRKARAVVVEVAPSDVKTPQELRNALLQAGRLGRLRLASLKWLGLKVELAPPQSEKEVSMGRLAALCGRKPMVVLVDEAHTLERDVGQYLLNLSQYVRKEGAFLLVLAGTPGLPAHLRKMDASFWDRSRQFGIGRLSHSEAKEALETPLAMRGTSIDADALETVASHGQRYAYFIQIWGEGLWDLCRTTEPQLAQLTAASVADVQEEVEKRMTDYYRHRYQELEGDGLLQAAQAVAPVFHGSLDATATDQDIDDALTAVYGKEKERLEAREKLNELGYIWCPPGQKPVFWYAGIPSLMGHVLDAASTH